MRIRRGRSIGPLSAPPTYQPEAPPSLPVSLPRSPSVDHHHATTGTMSSASQPKSHSPERETFNSPQAPELQPLSRHLDGVPSNSEPYCSPKLEGEALPQGRELVLVAPDVSELEGEALPQGRELVLVAPDVPMDAPALEATPLREKQRRRASRRRAEWTPPEGLQMIVQERKSGRSKGNKDTVRLFT